MSQNQRIIKAGGSGLGCFTTVALVLAILKIFNLIQISWLTIVAIWLAPLLLVGIIILVVLGAFALFAFFGKGKVTLRRKP